MADSMIHECKHCQERCSGVYCPNCKTKEQRLMMDKTNEEHFVKNNLAYFHRCDAYTIDVKHVHTPTCAEQHQSGFSDDEFFDIVGFKRGSYNK